NDLIKALHSSPFSREGETVRQKVIAVIRAHKISAELEKLRTLGFQVIPIDEQERLETIKKVTYQIDAVLPDNKLPHTLVEQLINKQIKVLWAEKLSSENDILSHAKAAGIKVITGRSLCEDALQLRNPQQAVAEPVN